MVLLTPEEWRHVTVRRHEAVTELRLHDDAGGSLVWNARVHQELADVWTWLAADEVTRVVVLRGTGEHFCSEIISPSSEREWHDIWLEGRRLMSGLVDLDVPVISVVNGPATIHAEVPLLADIVLAVPDAVFADRAHVVRGVVPGDGAQVVWRSILGARAGYFLLTGAEISSDEALALGFVHEVLDPARIDQRSLELAQQLARLDRQTLAYTRATLRSWDRTHLADAVRSGLAFAGLGLTSRR